jgi:hypothetical protein
MFVGVIAGYLWFNGVQKIESMQEMQGNKNREE